MRDADFDRLVSVAGPVSRETFDRLKAFEAEFRRWSTRINLAAPSTLPDLWNRHILDSAQLLPFVGETAVWIDIGSGGGFPGAVVAILLAERQVSRITLVESNRKKAAFLQTVLGQLRVPARVLAARIEDAAAAVPSADIVTARALAPLPDLLELASPWLCAGARGLFHKGRDYAAEVAKCHDAWRFDLVQHRSAIDADGVILEIANLERRHPSLTD